jgi:hypothetical protein
LRFPPKYLNFKFLNSSPKSEAPLDAGIRTPVERIALLT